MNMKAITILMTAIVTVASYSIHAQTYTVDTRNSTLQWHGKKVTGEHFGFIVLKNGKMMMKDGQITGGKFVIDMTTITNTDLKDETYNQKLVNHLKSDDFFGVETYPEAVLEIKSSSPFKNNEATVTAHLTIKKDTHPVTFVVSRDGDIYTAEIVVDRSRFDVRYGSGSFFDNLGDNMIYDDFTMNVRIKVNDPTQAGK